MSNKRHRRNKLSSLYIWHRYSGLLAALFIIFITVTGIALNHTDDLGLKKQHVSANFLLDSYNIQAPTRVLQFKTSKRTVTQTDDLLFVDSADAITAETVLTGAIEFNDFLLVTLTNTLLLIDADNQLVETLSDIDGVPNNISHIGLDNEQQINILANNEIYRFSTDLNLEKVAWDYNINWLTEEPLSEPDSSAIIQRYKSNIISLETLMLDVHSGRFFGSYGALFFDLVGIILLFLAFTGVIIWIKQQLKQNHQ
ncbi:MAG: PepSY domain-containing protein [Cycloclasticus sp.]|nr:PepSY domain-containing protein [Cycloclasticus sp.]